MHCWVCDKPVDRFLPYGLPPRPGKCPHCSAKPRHRSLLWLLRHRLSGSLACGAKVLEVGANPFSARRLPGSDYLGQARYVVADIQRLPYHDELKAPHGFVQSSVEALAFADELFDIVLCNNVLPYVPDYQRALREVRRCLKADGLAFVETHCEAGPTRSVAQYHRENPHLDETYFRTNGDVWVFGEDFVDSVARAGLLPRLLCPFENQDEAFHRYNGLKLPTSFLAAVRSGEGDRRFFG